MGLMRRGGNGRALQASELSRMKRGEAGDEVERGREGAERARGGRGARAGGTRAPAVGVRRTADLALLALLERGDAEHVGRHHREAVDDEHVALDVQLRARREEGGSSAAAEGRACERRRSEGGAPAARGPGFP
jgi:hypothetical protein